MMTSLRSAALAIVAAMLFPAVTSAAIDQLNESTAGNELAYPAGTDDLINQGQPTFVTVVHTDYAIFGGSNPDAMNDGSVGISSATFPAALATLAFDLDGAWSSTYYLDTALSPGGYDIDSIETIVGWLSPRTNQRYEVLYTTVSNPVFTSLGVFSYDALSLTGSTRVTLTDTAGSLATAVEAIRFVFQAPGFTGGDEPTYREIDIYGAATPTCDLCANLLNDVLDAICLVEAQSLQEWKDTVETIITDTVPAGTLCTGDELSCEEEIRTKVLNTAACEAVRVLLD